MPGSFAFDAERAKWTDRPPSDANDLWAWCISQTQDTLLNLLAISSAHAIDAVRLKGTPEDAPRLLHADALTKAPQLDVPASMAVALVAQALLTRVRERILPSITSEEPIQAWIIDDTGFPKKAAPRSVSPGNIAVNWASRTTARLRSVCRWPPIREACRSPIGFIGAAPPRGCAATQELSAEAWQTITWRDGTNTPLTSRFARWRVRPAHDDAKRTRVLAKSYLRKHAGAALPPHSRNTILTFFVVQGKKPIECGDDDFLIGDPPARSP
jgi:hypothetical protein